MNNKDDLIKAQQNLNNLKNQEIHYRYKQNEDGSWGKDLNLEEEIMTVAELIEYFKTLKQDYTIELGDSEYPNTEMTKDSIKECSDTKTYVIY